MLTVITAPQAACVVARDCRTLVGLHCDEVALLADTAMRCLGQPGGAREAKALLRAVVEHTADLRDAIRFYVGGAA